MASLRLASLRLASLKNASSSPAAIAIADDCDGNESEYWIYFRAFIQGTTH